MLEVINNLSIHILNQAIFKFDNFMFGFQPVWINVWFAFVKKEPEKVFHCDWNEKCMVHFKYKTLVRWF